MTQEKLFIYMSTSEQQNVVKVHVFFKFIWKLTKIKIKTNDVISRNGKNGGAVAGQGHALISVNLICTYSVTSH